MKAQVLILLLVVFAVIASSVGVVQARDRSRHLAVQLGYLEQQHDDAMAEWSRLQLEQAWLADAGQIENKARKELGMTAPESTRILVVRP